MEFILRFELIEEDAALVKGFDVGDERLIVTIDETVGCSHVKEKTVADKFGGGVIRVGAE